MSTPDLRVEQLTSAFIAEINRRGPGVDRSAEFWYGALAAAIVPTMREIVRDVLREEGADR